MKTKLLKLILRQICFPTDRTAIENAPTLVTEDVYLSLNACTPGGNERSVLPPQPANQSETELVHLCLISKATERGERERERDKERKRERSGERKAVC